MKLLRYFDTDDGSLPELEVRYSDPDKVSKAFEFLFANNARSVTASGGYLWIKASQKEKPFTGSGDASLVVCESAEPFHVVLAGITIANCTLPDLGVLVMPSSLTIDYRMGSAWGTSEINALLILLKKLCGLGGTLVAPWWGAECEHEFAEALRRA
ncbi:hypothetical protein ACOCLD_11510 [Pseudomonas sp. MAC6]|uniref:hypothetical protein n=1 Tax=Pseudomonas sp. MAC6 TaxID=3401633 RepID=UPI003BF482D0